VTALVIGSEAVGSDGYRGEVLAVVVDPAAQSVTHLVVEPRGREGLARLVPLDLADLADLADTVGAGPDPVRLRCTETEFMNLEPAEETLAEFVPGYPDPVQLLPPGWRGTGGGTADGGTILRIPEKETIDVVPPGEVEERRGDHVHATDGDIGRVQGLVIDPRSHHVTHVLLQEGHLWGRKEVSIPISSVTRVDDGIWLSITKQDVAGLPPVDINHPAG